ncbi:helix-turn-helix domain-containing protein [Cohnella zeiphila]|uniref:Helix-turn-helix transcriptional regulator n=1 Tax=Cohnella zeiphila TaxID=2761120 RepID=A0A7X0VZ24_9BACL|nr:AraC family transcriptional regulator [Cohnella zeiphila]MBB6733553.1 helix-turn-helix transcriptional regulator [Cohnella zeiphila]
MAKTVFDRSRPPHLDAAAGLIAEMRRLLSGILADSSRHVSLEQLGELFHMHPTYISNRFKKTFDITSIQLQKRLALDKAKKLLKAGSRTVGEVGGLVGYKDLDDFSRFFKKQTGCRLSITGTVTQVML